MKKSKNSGKRKLLTACLVVRNEQQLISRCLESLNGVADEIVLVHDGPCFDNTLQIAKEMGCQVFVRPFMGDAAHHRHFSVGKASGKWVLIIDADEYLSDELKVLMRNVISKCELDNVSCVEFRSEVFVNYVRLKKGVFGRWYRRMLYRRSEISAQPLRANGSLLTNGKTAKNNLVVHHRPTRDNYSWKAFTTRWKRLYYAEAAQIAEEKRLISLPKAWYYFKAPFAFLWHFFGLLKQNVHAEGAAGLKVAFFSAAYYFMLNFYIGRLKGRDSPFEKYVAGIRDQNPKEEEISYLLSGEQA